MTGDKGNPNGSVDLLAQAMRQAFSETVGRDPQIASAPSEETRASQPDPASSVDRVSPRGSTTEPE